jgi:WhiB family transcriptional regulator, redox-sensing transcriptional regulator
MWPRQMPHIPVASDQSWRSEANCRGLGFDLFFPEKGDTPTANQARGVCRGCTVQDECLAYALDVRVEGGVWGGTSERERDEIRKRERGAA